MNSNKVRGNPGYKFYKCYHGQCKTLTITKAMRSSLNGKSIHMCVITSDIQYISIGLVGHLKTHFPAMYRLFLVLKDRDEPPSEDEIAIASGKKTFDPTKAAEYLVKLEKASATLVDAFAKQNQQAAVNSFLFFQSLPRPLFVNKILQEANWDQETFERLLSEWMVTCDQPFSEVDQPSF